MAELLEIQALFNDNDLSLKVVAATVISANNLLSGTPTAADRAFAAAVFSNPVGVGKQVLMSVLATNHALTVAQITGASKAAIQGNVDTVIPNLVSALAGA